MPEETLRDIQKLLREPGETPQRSGGEGAAPPQRFCGACWAALPVDAVDCPSCGRSLAELEAARQAKAAADQAWVPPTRADGAPATPVTPSTAAADYGLAPAPAPTVPEPLAQELRKSRHHFLMAVAIGSAWGGAVMVAAWFTIQNFSPKNNGTLGNAPMNAAVVANTPITNPVNGPDTSTTPVTVQTKDNSRVAWQNSYPELRLELASLKGAVVARQPDEARVAPGRYRVRICPREGGWHVKGGTVLAEGGAQLDVPITATDAATFFVELGGRFSKANKTEDAISAWERALEVDAKNVRAHLCLGTALPLQHRSRDAREHLDAVLAIDPNNAEAKEGKQLLDELEQLEKSR